MRPLHLMVLSAWITSPCLAQDLTPKATPAASTVVIRGATIHTVSGPILLDATLWFEDGIIRGLARSTDGVPELEGAESIDGANLHVYPGLVTANTTVGLVEYSQVRQSVDSAELGDLNPEVLAAVAVNPDSTAIPVARTNGILTMGVFPQRGIVPGRISVMNLDGWTNEDMTVRADAGLSIRWSTGDEARQSLDKLIVDARAWHRAREAQPDLTVDLRLQAMGSVLRGDAKVFLAAQSVAEIEQAVVWATDHGLRPVIVGGRDARLCLPLLEKHRVPVMVLGTHRLPRRRDAPIDDPFTLPLALHEAGVPWCLASGDSFYNERNLPYHAATAAAYGLPPAEAIRAITLYPARVLGVEKRLGSLDVGKDATLIVTDGSPLELTTKVVHAFVRGGRVDLSNKQTELEAKYRERYRQLTDK